MNWWVKCISVAIARTANRNVAFKAGRVRDSIMKDQDEFIMLMRELDSADVGLGEDYEDILADVDCNVELYIFNQENTDLFREMHTRDASFALHGPGPILLSVA